MQEMNQILSIITQLEVIIAALKTRSLSDSDMENVRQTVLEVNSILYHSSFLKLMGEDYLKGEDFQKSAEELESLVKIWKCTINRRYGKHVDAEFWEIYEFFKYVDQDVIYERVKNCFLGLPEALRIDFLALPHRYTFLKEKLDFVKEDYSLIRIHVEMMADHIDDYQWLYMHLADYRSKMVLNGIIKYWFSFDVNKLHTLLENTFLDYYDLDILQCNEKDTMVDLGAYTGDSILDYINTYGAYKKIYAYEITKGIYETCKENLSEFPDIIFRRKGIGSKRGIMYIDSGNHGAGNKLLEDGDDEIEVVSLDEDIAEQVSVIKMDIEGAEKEAILGAKAHIVNEKPKLLISAYHNPEDLFELPKLIDTLRDDYKFYLRFNGHGCLWPCDYVLFAV